MLKNTLFILAILCSSCAYQRIGDLTMISNRNIDSSREYVLVKRNAEAKIKTSKDDSLERVIDELTEANEGDYLMNAKVFVKNNGKVIKIQGDVWGEPSVKVDVISAVEARNKIGIGDRVSFKSTGKLLEGLILGINQESAVVEFKNLFGKVAKKEVPFAELTKLSNSN